MTAPRSVQQTLTILVIVRSVVIAGLSVVDSYALVRQGDQGVRVDNLVTRVNNQQERINNQQVEIDSLLRKVK